jgi:hypothetical protein
MEKKKFTTEDGIEFLRSQRGVPGTAGGLLYAFFGNSPPKVLAKIEEQFGAITAVKLAFHAELEEAEDDPKKAKEILDRFSKIVNNKKPATDEE